MEIVGEVAKKARKPGRPRAIPVEMERVVVELYREGYGIVRLLEF